MMGIMLQKFYQTDDFLEKAEILQRFSDQKQVEVIPELLKIIEAPLGDDALQVMVEATLTELFHQKKEAVVEGLRSPSELIQAFCLPFAAKFRRSETVSSLLAMLESHTTPDLTIGAIRALRIIGKEDYFDDLAVFIKKSDPTIASAAIIAISDIHPDRSREILLPAFDSLHEIAALAVLEELSPRPTPDVIDFLISHIHHPNPVIRRIVAAKLISLDRQVSRKICSKLFVGTRDERILAANILAEIKDEELIPALVMAVKSEDPNIRFAALDALGAVVTPESSALCFDLLYDPERTVRFAVLNILENKISEEVFDGIRKIASFPKGRKVLVEALANVAAPRIFEMLQDLSALVDAVFGQIFDEGNSELIAAYEKVIFDKGFIHLSPILKKYQDRFERQESLLELHVLVVDDSMIFRHLVSKPLLKAGYRVTTAINGQDAFDRLHEESFQIILTDMNMPIKNGIELARDVRANKKFDAIPMVMITTEQEESQRNAASEAGIDWFLTKPFDDQELLDVVEKFLKEGGDS